MKLRSPNKEFYLKLNGKYCIGLLEKLRPRVSPVEVLNLADGMRLFPSFILTIYMSIVIALGVPLWLGLLPGLIVYIGAYVIVGLGGDAGVMYNAASYYAKYKGLFTLLLVFITFYVQLYGVSRVRFRLGLMYCIIFLLTKVVGFTFDEFRYRKNKGKSLRYAEKAFVSAVSIYSTRCKVPLDFNLSSKDLDMKTLLPCVIEILKYDKTMVTMGINY